MVISTWDTLRTAIEVDFMFGACQTPAMGTLLFLPYPGVHFFPDTLQDPPTIFGQQL